MMNRGFNVLDINGNILANITQTIWSSQDYDICIKKQILRTGLSNIGYRFVFNQMRALNVKEYAWIVEDGVFECIPYTKITFVKSTLTYYDWYSVFCAIAHNDRQDDFQLSKRKGNMFDNTNEEYWKRVCNGLFENLGI